MITDRLPDGQHAAPAQDDSPWSRWTSGNMPLVLLLGVIAAFQLATIRAGHIWGDDFALYILHARALLEGSAYGDTGFIYHPQSAGYSPRSYPPGFPLLLLPVYALFGLNYVAMKVVVAVLFVASIALFAVLIRSALPQLYTLAVVALLGFSPYLTDFKNNVLPDLPFIFFIMVSVLLIQRIDRPGSQWSALRSGALAGAVAFFTMAVRTIGIVIFGAIVLSQLFKRKRPGPAVLAFLLTGLLLYGAQRMVTPPGSGYGSQVADVATTTDAAKLIPGVNKAKDLVGETFLLWDGLPHRARNGIGLLIFGLGAAGLLLRLRQSAGIIEAFVISYSAAIFLFPAMNLRYILPVIPFMLYYAAVATSAMARRVPWIHGAAAGITLLLAAGYAAELSRSEYGVIDDGATSVPALELYSAVTDCTGADERIMFGRPRALALYTRRPSLFAPYGDVDKLDFIEQNDIRFAIVRRGDLLHSVIEHAPAGFIVVFANDEFILYQSPTGIRSGSSTQRCGRVTTG